MARDDILEEFLRGAVKDYAGKKQYIEIDLSGDVMISHADVFHELAQASKKRELKKFNQKHMGFAHYIQDFGTPIFYIADAVLIAFLKKHVDVPETKYTILEITDTER
jgi:hypothetical protein